MKKIKSVLAFGDRTTAGLELNYPLSVFKSRAYLVDKVPIEELDAPGKLLTFPQKVADKLGVPCYNFAMSGGTNQRSIRLLTKAVQQHPDSLVLFSWGRPDMAELYCPEGGVGCDSDNYFQAGSGNFESEMNTKWLEIYHYKNHLEQQMFMVDAICRLHTTDFLQIPLYLKSTEPEYVPSTTNLLNFGEYTNAEDYAISKGCKQLVIHYGEDFHLVLADLIIDYLKRKGTIE
jgi:hypothetical protein